MLMQVRPDQHVPVGTSRNCSIALTLGVLDDAWTFLVVREAFFGARRYGEFADRLGCARVTLSRTLQRLVSADIFRTTALGKSDRVKSYSLTDAGRALYPVFLGLMRFGDTWLWQGTTPLALFHLRCRSWFSAQPVWRRDLASIDVTQVTVSIDDGYWIGASSAAPRRRKVSSRLRALSSRPCSVERTLEVIGDRWTFLVLREFFHGNHGFDAIERNIGVAPNILADRLRHLLDHHVIERTGGSRPVYALSAAGRDLYPCMLLMKEWGDRWRLGEPPTIHLRRGTGPDESAIVICPSCAAEITPRDVAYITNYGPADVASPGSAPVEEPVVRAGR
jgi:DNA-binding HxlR family transcriptional regulator